MSTTTTVTYLTVEEAAAELKLTSRRIRQLIVDGELPARRVGWAYLIEPADLAPHRQRPPRGPKPKPKK